MVLEAVQAEATGGRAAVYVAVVEDHFPLAWGGEAGVEADEQLEQVL